MVREGSEKKILKTVLFIILSAISLYYIWKGFSAVKSLISISQKFGSTFINKYPLAFVSDILQSVVCTGLLIYLSVSKGISVFVGKGAKPVVQVIITAAIVVMLTIAEVAFFYGLRTILPSYKLLEHLKSYLSINGIISFVIFVFLIFYLVYSLVLTAQSDSSTKD